MSDKKDKQLEQYRRRNTGPGKKMTSDSGTKISNDRWSLRAGKRGPTLLQDTHFYRKQSSFNRERIPEKVVHARSFAYRDADYHRLGTANINEITVNRPIVDVNTNRRDGYSKYRIDVDDVTYHENSLACNTPSETPGEKGGYVNYPEKVNGYITRERPSESFFDYFSQARLFWNSLAPFEKRDLVDTFIFHLQSVKSKSVKQQNVEMWAHVDRGMACTIADNIGVEHPRCSNVSVSKYSPAISMANTPHYACTQKVGVLIGNGFNDSEVRHVLNGLKRSGVFVDIISQKLGTVTGNDGTKIEIEETFKTKYSVLYDSIYVVGGRTENQSQFNENIMEFCHNTYKYYKPIGVATTGQCYINMSNHNNLDGVVFAKNNSKFVDEFICAIAQKRFWNRK